MARHWPPMPTGRSGRGGGCNFSRDAKGGVVIFLKTRVPISRPPPPGNKRPLPYIDSNHSITNCFWIEMDKGHFLWLVSLQLLDSCIPMDSRAQCRRKSYNKPFHHQVSEVYLTAKVYSTCKSKSTSLLSTFWTFYYMWIMMIIQQRWSTHTY